jgi:hypothetical protein
MKTGQYSIDVVPADATSQKLSLKNGAAFETGATER